MGKNIKHKFEHFSFYDHTGIESHLEEMAADGWLIEKIGGIFWTYKRIEPKNLHFAVTYYPKASVLDPEPLDGQIEFQEYCVKNKWQHICSNGQLQIFYNEEENHVPMETDPIVEVTVIHKAAKRRLLPSYFILIAIALLQFANDIPLFFSNPIEYLSNSINISAFFNIAFLFILAVMELVKYFHWHRKAYKTAQNGEFLESHSNKLYEQLILFIVILSVGYTIMSIINVNNKVFSAILLGTYVGIYLIFCSTNVMQHFLKSKGTPKSLNYIATTAIAVFLHFIIIGLGIFAITTLPDNDKLSNQYETYEYNGHTYTIYQDTLPLDISDLQSKNLEGYTREKKTQKTMLVETIDVRQAQRFDIQELNDFSINYTVAIIKAPFFYNLCKTSLLKNNDKMFGDYLYKDHYEEIDATPWSAEEAYQYHWSNGVLNNYILCYSDRIIQISFSWEPTEEQMKTVSEKLAR